MKTIHKSVQSKPTLAIGLTDQQICVNSKFLLNKLQYRLIKDEKIKESNMSVDTSFEFSRAAQLLRMTQARHATSQNIDN